MTETLTLYKLIILYMLDKVDFPLTTSQISEFILEQGYTTYFRLQEALSEMTESKLILTEATHGRTLYHPTQEGSETLRFFDYKISSAIRQDIDTFLAEKRYELKGESAVKAYYTLNNNQEYVVRCQLVEDGYSLIDLKLIVPTETEAKTIAANWRTKSQDIYTSIFSQLL